MHTAFYVHIPFCPSGCRFCHFYINGNKKAGYIDLLRQEYNIRFKGKIQEVSCIHIGGGTPNLLSEGELKDLLAFLSEKLTGYNEFSIELHPALCTKKQIDVLYKGGINRISFGVQSLDESILSNHTRVNMNYEFLDDLVLYAKKVGIKKINLDFIYDLIGDSTENVKNNFAFISKCKPTSVYYYRLRRLTEHLKDNHLPDEKRAFGYYLQIKHLFQENKYIRLNNAVYYDPEQLGDSPPFLYDEIIYSTNHNLIGVGVAATSEIEGHFTKNICSYEDYKKSLLENNKVLLDQDFHLNTVPRLLNRLYFFFLQKSTIHIPSFIQTFGDAPEIYSAVEELEKYGLLSSIDSNTMVLTEKGHYYFDEKIGDILFSQYKGEFELLKKL